MSGSCLGGPSAKATKLLADLRLAVEQEQSLPPHSDLVKQAIDAIKSRQANSACDGLLKDERDIGDVVVRTQPNGAPLLVRNVADVKIGAALRYGVLTHAGQGEAVSGIVMMLLGANSRDVVRAVGQRVKEIQRDLPPGVKIDVIYDRADFVGRTLHTVVRNLAEGVLIVMVVLAIFLGSLRGALAVVLGIPASMSVALLGMHAFGVTGDLMSLGAIDFGFLVDGPIIILEAVIAATVGQRLQGDERAAAYESVARGAVRPVALSVTIIMLVYLPLHVGLGW